MDLPCDAGGNWPPGCAGRGTGHATGAVLAGLAAVNRDKKRPGCEATGLAARIRSEIIGDIVWWGRISLSQDVYAALVRRLGRRYAEQRLRIEDDHEAQVFGQGI